MNYGLEDVYYRGVARCGSAFQATLESERGRFSYSARPLRIVVGSTLPRLRTFIELKAHGSYAEDIYRRSPKHRLGIPDGGKIPRSLAILCGDI